MEWIVKVQEKQDDFIRIIHDLGEHFYAEDIVQEFYIKLMKYGKEEKVFKDGELNMGYLYTILKNLFLNYQQEKQKVHKVDIEDNPIAVEYDYYQPNDSDYLEAEIIKEMNTWQYFDNGVFRVYTGIQDKHREDAISMRAIAEGSNISTKTIFYTLKRCKAKIRQKLNEQYQDFVNQKNKK